MDLNIEMLIDKVAGHVKQLASTDTVLGDEFQLGEYACRPVIKAGTGFGSGAGNGTDPKTKSAGDGGGAGAGVGVSPVGFLVAKGDEISFIPSDRSGLSALIEKIPDLVEKVAEMKKEKAGAVKDEGKKKEAGKKA